MKKPTPFTARSVRPLTRMLLEELLNRLERDTEGKALEGCRCSWDAFMAPTRPNGTEIEDVGYVVKIELEITPVETASCDLAKQGGGDYLAGGCCSVCDQPFTRDVRPHEKRSGQYQSVCDKCQASRQ